MGSIWTIKADDKPIDGLEFVDDDGVAHKFSIRVKKRLSVGETRRMMTSGWGGFKSRTGQDATEISVDWQTQSFARAHTWLTEWSLRDEEGKALPLTRQQIEDLHPEVFRVIDEAIQKHVEESEQEKKAKAGSTSPSTTSV